MLDNMARKFISNTSFNRNGARAFFFLWIDDKPEQTLPEWHDSRYITKFA